MSLVQYSPWSLFDAFDRAASRVPAAAARDADSWAPAVDIQEETNRYLVHADIPGVDPKDIEVSVDKGVLTVKGERKAIEESEDNGYSRIERSYGSFSRSFTLPESVDADAIEASGSNGVLTIAIPKAAEIQPRRIEVKH